MYALESRNIGTNKKFSHILEGQKGILSFFIDMLLLKCLFLHIFNTLQ